jgi:GH24 family phage-related lysozyme (muramidase)
MRISLFVGLCLFLLVGVFQGKPWIEGNQHSMHTLRNFEVREFNMYFSDKGIEELKGIEGFRSKPYIDDAGYATIGYGHKIKKGEMFTSLTEMEADQLLRRDAAPIEDFINDHLDTLVSQNQFDALVIFIFNIGQAAFLNSSVFQDIKEKKYAEATKPWAKWINISKFIKDDETGEVVRKLIPVQGLINRRAKEIQLFNA